MNVLRRGYAQLTRLSDIPIVARKPYNMLEESMLREIIRALETNDPNVRVEVEDETEQGLFNIMNFKNPAPANLDEDEELKRFASVAIIGAPNAGKSTLMNLMVDSKVSAVSRKRHTTATQILGVLTYNEIQLAFYDTPGAVAINDRSAKRETKVKQAWHALQESDVGLVLIDAAKSLSEAEYTMMRRLEKLDRTQDSTLCLILNKMDLVHPKSVLDDLSEKLNKMVRFDETFIISAAEDEGVDELKNFLLFECSKPSPWAFDEGIVTDLTEEERVGEILREKFFSRYNQEVPHVISTEVAGIRRHKDGHYLIQASVHVDTGHQKAIILGKGGEALQQVISRATKDLQRILGKRVDLRISVLVGES